MSLEYQQYQAQLAQFRQEQRARELEIARQQLAQNLEQGRMRFQSLMQNAAAARFAGMGMSPDFGHGSGYAGPAYSTVGPSGVAYRSTSSIAMDNLAMRLNTASGGDLFLRAGFSEAYSRPVTEARRREELSGISQQFGRNFAAALTPDFLMRRGAFGTYMGQDALFAQSRDLQGALAGLRGESATGIGGRGVSYDRASGIVRNVFKELNARSGGAYNTEQLTELTSAASAFLTTSETRSIGTGQAGVFAKVVENLEKIAKNTGLNYEQLGFIVNQAKSFGFNSNAALNASRVARSNRMDLGVNEAELTFNYITDMSVGRRLGFNADTFARAQFTNIQNQVGAANVGMLSQDALYRFGGENDYDAARRRQSFYRESFSLPYTEANVGRFGVMGADASLQKLLSGGIMGFTGDLANQLVRDPTAGIRAMMDPAARQGLESNAGALAYASSQALAPFYRSMGPKAAEDLVRANFLRTTGLGPVEGMDLYKEMRAKDYAVRSVISNVGGDFNTGFGLFTKLSGAGANTPDILNNFSTLYSRAGAINQGNVGSIIDSILGTSREGEMRDELQSQIMSVLGSGNYEAGSGKLNSVLSRFGINSQFIDSGLINGYNEPYGVQATRALNSTLSAAANVGARVANAFGMKMKPVSADDIGIGGVRSGSRYFSADQIRRVIDGKGFNTSLLLQSVLSSGVSATDLANQIYPLLEDSDRQSMTASSIAAMLSSNDTSSVSSMFNTSAESTYLQRKLIADVLRGTPTAANKNVEKADGSQGRPFYVRIDSEQ